MCNALKINRLDICECAILSPYSQSESPGKGGRIIPRRNKHNAMLKIIFRRIFKGTKDLNSLKESRDKWREFALKLSIDYAALNLEAEKWKAEAEAKEAELQRNRTMIERITGATACLEKPKRK